VTVECGGLRAVTKHISVMKDPVIVRRTPKKVVTSLPGWRETHRAEENNRYFDFKQLKLCVHVDIYYISI
jgi:hypothetical protein